MGAFQQSCARRADLRIEMAARATAKAEALLANRNRDFAFISQPGRIPGRAAEIARTDRAMELLQTADRHLEKARNLNAMSQRHAGDAERERQARREAADWSVGQSVNAVLYGPATVLKVNAKSLRLRLERTGGEITEDKSRVRAAS